MKFNIPLKIKIYFYLFSYMTPDRGINANKIQGISESEKKEDLTGTGLKETECDN